MSEFPMVTDERNSREPDDPMPPFPQEPVSRKRCALCDDFPGGQCPACAVPDSVGPFPQEPAFGSPEAQAQATRYLLRLPGMNPGAEREYVQAEDYDALQNEVARLRARETQLEIARGQRQRERDALADALAHFYEHGYDRGKAEAALRLAGRLPQEAP